MNIPLNIDWQQILLHLFNFAILAGGLYFLLYKPVANFMDKRTAYYKELDEKANEKIASADALVKEREDKLAGVDDEIKARRAEAQAETDRMTELQLSETRRQAEHILSEAKAEVEREHQKMLNSARRELSAIALSTAEKALKEDSGDAYDSFLSSAERGNGHDGT